MGIFERYLSVWVGLCILLGVVLGNAAPGVFAALAAFDLVDAVSIFEEDTPQNLISLLQPDVIVKGGDYQPADVIGGDIVKKRGGKVVIVPTYAAYSTSKLVTSR